MKRDTVRLENFYEYREYSLVGFGGTDQSCQLSLVFTSYFSDCNNRRGLLVDQCPQTGFRLDDDIWYTHLATKRGEVYHELNRVNIMSDGNKRGFLSLDEGNDVVKAIFNEMGLLGFLLSDKA